MTDVQIIPRQEAIDFLAKPKPTWVERLWDRSGFSAAKIRGARNARGPGSKVDLINYGLRSPSGKLLTVARIALAPYQNRPAEAAVGKDLAGCTVYLMRLGAIGIEHEALVQFVSDVTLRLRTDLATRGRAARYLLSLDDPTERLIEGRVLRCSRGVTGKVYVEAGALHAGTTTSRGQATRYVTSDGQVRSIYQNGVNVAAEVQAQGCQIIHEGAKHRFIWVLAPRGSLEYTAWRRALPAWVREPAWGEDGLGWVQPRLLFGRPVCRAVG